MGYLTLGVTIVAGFAATDVAVRAVDGRSRDNERSVCTASWDRYDGRVGIRSEMFAIRDRFIKDSASPAYLDFTELTDSNIPPLEHPKCDRPAGMPPERPMP